MSGDAVILGKRKERIEDSQIPSGSTIFVSNLPYTATSTDLKTLFSDFAPVRSAFVVVEDNVSKGVGYVSFAIKEDAKTTLETVEKDGLELNGRKLRAQLADPKPKDKMKEKKIKSEHKTPAPPQASHPRTPKDPNAIRTVVISGLPSSVDNKLLWKKVKKLKGAESVELIEGEPGVAHALFSSPAAATHAVEKLHAHVFKGSILSVALKKRLENLAKAPTVGKEGTSPSTSPSRGSRLIVRNLPWNISENDLRSLFLPFGPIYSINIPMVNTQPNDLKTSNSKPRAKGFAFVWFFSKKDAERAISGVNGRSVEAGSIVVPTMNKKERQRLRRQLREKAKSEVTGDAGGLDDEDEGDDTEGESEKTPKDSGSTPRVLAVDWALSKDKWEEVKAKTMTGQVEAGPDIDTELDAEQTSENESDGESKSHEDDSEEDSVTGRDDDRRSDADEAIEPTLPQTDVGTTLFLRNVPYDATEDELRVLFRSFGPLRYARITVDPETGRSRGTGFVCFWNRDDADKAIQQSELLNRETGIDNLTTSTKKNPFSLPSLLTPDPSSSLAQSLVLHGRTLDVTRAVTREEAVRLKDEGERQREKTDKRNLYLLREGVIFPNSPAAATLSAAELEKRQASFNSRRALLKSNPLLYVSKTRLSIRQLPLFVTERVLKRLGVHAVRAFEEEVKLGEREPHSAEELRADTSTLPEGEEEGNASKKNKIGKKFERETGVRQAKIVRQADRVDVLTGNGRSRGYGFLEMKKHSDALRVLRWANNNQSLYSILEEWWKDEAEDVIKTLGQKQPKAKSAGDNEGEDAEARVHRLKSEVERLKAGGHNKGSRKALIIEFSIENTQVVNRRKEKSEAVKSTPKRAYSNSAVVGDDEVEVGGDNEQEIGSTRRAKRRKLDKSAPSTNSAKPSAKPGTSESGSAKLGNAIGSMIGRKRKLRKVKGKGKT